MTYRNSAPLIAALLFTLSACPGDDNEPTTGNPTIGVSISASGSPTGNPTGDPTGDPTDGGTTGDPTGDPTDSGEPEDGPHALGTIFLGETHPTAGGVTTPSVSASFIPDAAVGGATACTESVAGCQIALFPDCGGGGCGAGEYCGFDDSCNATCVRVCDAQCGPDEVCYFPSPGTPGCKKAESFDAGSLTFMGTTIPITLFPPYGFTSDDNASPFAPGGTAKVLASGAAGAGFEKFEKEFTGTDFIQTSPKLNTLGFSTVFGNGPLPVKWSAGTGDVTITASVVGTDFATGTVTCKADDAKGSFDIPREALKAAIDGGDISGLTVSVQRQRVDTYKDLTTKGELTGVTVQPVGYLNIITSSIEIHTFEGCSPGEAVCNEMCVDVQYDSQNCGDCGVKCADEDTCQEGTCNGLTACNACADASQTGACKPENDACNANAACKSFETCWLGCQTQQCQEACLEDVTQETLDLYNAQVYCICEDACVGECAGLCS